MKVFVVTQHYPPNISTTASVLQTIAQAIALDVEVVVLSGWPDFARPAGNPRVFEIVNRDSPAKDALVRRSLDMISFGFRALAAVVRHARAGDCVIVVPAPFLLPYFAVLGARLRKAKSALVMHDLYPDCLVRAGLIGARSLRARLIHTLNEWMFRRLDAVVTIGRDQHAVLMRYAGVTPDKVAFIPNWSTMPAKFHPIDRENPFRKPFQSRFIVGLSGNLGFTHDPMTVFEAARRLAHRNDIGFLLSGWGVGWRRLKEAQAEARLPNVTLVERVDESDLATFLSAADLWVIPYLPKMAGISVPSRLYNLMAIGRPVIVLAEPEAEHALILSENDVGWAVAPGSAEELAAVIVRAVANPTDTMAKGERAVRAVGAHYTLAASQEAYRKLAGQLLGRAKSPDPPVS